MRNPNLVPRVLSYPRVGENPGNEVGVTLGHPSETFRMGTNYITFDTLNYSWIVFLLAAGGITYVRD